MYEAMATVIGTVVTHPAKRDLNTGEQVLTFRMASNSRRFDQATGTWVDNGTLFLTVSCWRRLVAGVEESIRRGDPVVVYGQLRSHEYRTRDGVERRDLEMRASAVGPDLGRCTARIARRSTAETGTESQGVIRGAEDRSSAESESRLGSGVGETAVAVVSPSTQRPEREPLEV